MGNWFDVLYQEGGSIGSAGDGISGLQYFFVLAIDAVFLFSWRVLGVWRKNVLLAQAPPFAELILRLRFWETCITSFRSRDHAGRGKQ